METVDLSDYFYFDVREFCKANMKAFRERAANNPPVRFYELDGKTLRSEQLHEFFYEMMLYAYDTTTPDGKANIQQAYMNYVKLRTSHVSIKEQFPPRRVGYLGTEL
jgi:hypothetical protein